MNPNVGIEWSNFGSQRRRSTTSLDETQAKRCRAPEGSHHGTTTAVEPSTLDTGVITVPVHASLFRTETMQEYKHSR
jgi:hypothetical protein